MSNPSIDPIPQRDPAGEMAGPPSAPENGSPVSDFWRHKSLDELIAEQGVQPIDDFEGFLDEIGGVWPEEESIDEFLAWLAELRRRG